MIEFEIGGQQYRAAKLDAFKQFHLSRKLAPVLPTLLPLFMEVARETEGGDLMATFKDKAGDIAKLLEPFTDAIASMPDEAAEYILGTCLSVVQRQNGQRWAPIWSGNVCMFDDIDLGQMFQMSGHVIRDSLGPFIAGLLTSQEGSPTSE